MATHRLCILLLGTSGGCRISDEDRMQAADRDSDGFDAVEVGGLDCDDARPDVNPDEPESCLDDIDHDCDGTPCWARQDVDPGEAWVWGTGHEAMLGDWWVPAYGEYLTDVALAVYEDPTSSGGVELHRCSTGSVALSDGHHFALVSAPQHWPDELEAEGSPDGDAPGGQFGFHTSRRGTLSITDADLRLVPLHVNHDIDVITGVGDLNGDGHEDLAASSIQGAGEVMVFFGPVEGTRYATDADVQLFGGYGETVTSAFGGCLRGRVDANGDGNDDLFISATGEGREAVGNGLDGAGATYLFFGPLYGVAGPDHARWEGGQLGGHQARTVVADVTGDGEPDLLLGAPTSASMDYVGTPGTIHRVPGAFSGL